MAALTADDIAIDLARDVQGGSLIHFHQRLGYILYDTIERIVCNPDSGLELTDRRRLTYVTCMHSKQTKNAQSQQDSGAISPIERIGGVICSDLKGPLMPKDRLGNRYSVNFVDHKRNYCREFFAKSKDQAAKKFEQFLAFYERRFGYKILVLRTDKGGEYRNVDRFCQMTSVARQISEARNQASNGKKERTHRTMLNMARAMIFACNMPLFFWGDAVDYVTYILNRSPKSANE